MSDYVSTSQGRLGYALLRAYSPSDVYNKRDLVAYQNGTYAVLKDGITGVTPVSDGLNYLMFAGPGIGVNNASWFAGTEVAGRGSGIAATVIGSKAGDMYLNNDTSDIYLAVAADTWDWKMNLLEGVNLKAEDVSTSDGGSVQGALNELASRKASEIPTTEPGVSVQGALDGKLAKANLANNLTTTTPGQYALDAAQGKVLNDAIPTEAVPLSVQRGGTGAKSIPGLAQTLHPTQFPQPGWLLTLGPTGYAGGAGITAMAELLKALNLQSGAGTYIQSGLTFISLTANVDGSLAVYFPVPFPGQPRVVATPNTDKLAGRSAGVLSPDENGFTLTARAEVSYAMPVFWVAVYKP